MKRFTDRILRGIAADYAAHTEELIRKGESVFRKLAEAKIGRSERCEKQTKFGWYDV